MTHAYVCRSCGAAWAGGSSYLVLTGRPGWQRWSRMPGQVVAAVRRERTWEPVPQFYAMVGAAAATPAAVAAVATRARGRWWWPPGAAATAIGAVFVLSAVSAFRGGSAGRAIARVVAPGRARAAELDRQVAAIRRVTARRGVLVPATWHGSLAIEGSHWSGRGRDRRLTGFSVAAHDHDTPVGEPRLEILHEFGDMPQALVEDQAVAMVVGGESLTAMPDDRHQQSQEAWQDDHVLVDGSRVPARRVAGQQAHAVVFDHDGCWIAVTSTGIDLSGFELTATRDIDPLLDERIRRANARSPR